MGKTLAFIPARSGSKGVKDKNIKALCGKPLILYTVEAATQSNLFSRVFVSTDSSMYAEIIRSAGIDVPFLRAGQLSGDTSSVWDAVSEALSFFQKEFGETYDSVCLLQPTSPLRTCKEISEAYALFKARNADSVISVTEAEHSPLLYNVLNDEKSLENFISTEVRDSPRQKLPIFYKINGAIYWVKTATLGKRLDLYGKASYAYIMPQEKSIDIDNQMDFLIAEMILKKSRKKSKSKSMVNKEIE